MLIPLCTGIGLEAPVDPPFSTTEQNLVCGERDTAETAWQHIPRSQARFFFRSFLQSRGYHQPQFTEKAGVLHVNPGVQSTVAAVRPNLQTELAPTVHLDLHRNRELIGETLTPSFLDRVERWTYGRLQNLGYPCPSVTSQADPTTGAVLLNLNPGPRLPLKQVIEGEGIPGVMSGTLRRYDAFRIGETFQGDLMALTERRVVLSEVAQNIHFTVERCDPDGAVVRQEVTPGQPRLLSFGFGSNTEGILLARASWKNSRLGDQASSLEIQLLASAIRQDVSAWLNWYYLPFPSRIFLRPSFTTTHHNEDPFEVFSAAGRVIQARTWDFSAPWTTIGMAASLGVGPKLEFINTIRGTGAKNSTFLSLEGRLAANSHSFEFHRLSPRSGFAGALSIDLNSKSILAPVSAQRLRLNGEGLWNFRNYEPALWIAGIRGGLNTTITSERTPFQELPPNYRLYLGGSIDLRGFSRLELPTDGYGSLTSLFTSFELRTGPLLPLGIAPLAFLDLGLLGSSPFSLDSTLYWSPGVGLRWESPIGVVRGTAAHGYITGRPDDPASHWQFFLSLGEEF